MLKENELGGAFAIYRVEVRPFTDKQIALVFESISRGGAAPNQLSGEIQAHRQGAGINLDTADDTRSRFAAYVEGLSA